MFHVEQFMKNTLFAIIMIVSLGLLGCDKPNPNPELLDPIYEDIQKELGSARAQVATAEKEVEEHKKSVKDAIPQSGQIKYAQKRFFEAQAKLSKAQQMLQYYELRAKSRVKWVKESYMKAYKEKKPWPDPAEWDEYKAQKALEQSSRSWNAKQRIEDAAADLKRSQAPAKPPSEH